MASKASLFLEAFPILKAQACFFWTLPALFA